MKKIVGLLVFLLVLLSLEGVFHFVDLIHVYGETNSLATVDNYLYVGSGASIYIYDIADPNSPILVNPFFIGVVFPEAMEIRNDLAYIAGSSLLMIYDISNPVSPVLLGQTSIETYNVNYTKVSLSLQNDRVFIAAGLNRLQIVDVSDPVNPVSLPSYYAQEDIRAVTADEDYIYIGIHSDEIQILSFTGAGSPELISSIDITYFVGTMLAEDHRLYVASEGIGLYVYDITNPLNPVDYFAGNDNFFMINSLCLDNNLLYAVYPYGLACLSVSDLDNISLIGNYSICIMEPSIAITGEIAYVSSEVGVLTLIDISEPEDTEALGSIDSFGSKVLGVENNILCLNSCNNVIELYNVANPANPQLLSSLSHNWDPELMACENGFLYLVKDNVGMEVIDINDPHHPTPIGMYANTGDFTDLKVHNGVAYLAHRTMGLLIINVENPSTPILEGVLAEQVITALAIRDDTVFAYNSYHFLMVIDASNPQLPHAVGFLEIVNGGCMISVYGDYLYVPGFDGDIRIIDIQNPAFPLELGTISLPPNVGLGAECMIIHGNVLYLSTAYSNMIYCFDLRQPQTPASFHTYFRNCSTMSMFIDNDRLYTSDYYAGVHILNLVPVSVPEDANPLLPEDLLNFYPNPFVSQTTMNISMQQRTVLDVAVYNLKGQLIRNLYHGQKETGNHTIVWDGRDNQGAEVAQGIYLVRSIAEGKSSVKKITRIKN